MEQKVSRRIRFLADFTYVPKPTMSIVYKAGSTEYVPLKCAELAIAKGVAEAIIVDAPGQGLAETLRKLGTGSRRGRRRSLGGDAGENPA